MKVTDFDYDLPPALIAQTPVEPRDASRLMVIDKTTGSIEHKAFTSIIDELKSGDLLVWNNTKVIPARIYGRKTTGARIEVMLLKAISHDVWEALVKPGKRVKENTEIIFGDGQLRGICQSIDPVTGSRYIKFIYDGIFEEILDQVGTMPLPPYITEELKEQSRYQTVYAKVKGSAAAPTAGLHFTPQLIKSLKQKDIEIAEVMLHVGLGTFRPVSSDLVEDHPMHSEYYEIGQETANKLNRAKQENRRIIAVGTTSVRTLESVMRTCGKFQAHKADTNIFIYPGYEFQAIDGMITNFHLPKSTLIMLVSAFMGRDLTMLAYEVAVKEQYRFFSFGDAMMIR